MADSTRSDRRKVRGRPQKSDPRNRPEIILQAAVRLYANHGFERVTTNDIAREAGVATSLVSHHFGSKAEFRATCNRYVLEQMHEILNEVIGALEKGIGHGDFISLASGLSSDRVHIVRYLTLLFLHDDDGSLEFFREYFAKFHQITEGLIAKGMIRDDIDPVWATMTRIFAQLGPAFLYRQVSELTGEDPYKPEVARLRFETISKIFRSGAFKSASDWPGED